MNKFLLVAITCALGATACSRLREPTDPQLGNLLRSERASPADAAAPLDGLAIECLRAWSGDSDLVKNLPMRSAGEDGRKACRTKLDGWIADAGRNPEKFTFADVSAPGVVRRAMELQAARSAAAMAKLGGQRPPAAPNVLPSQAVPAPDLNVDLGTAGTALQEAETLCQQANQKAAEPGANQRLVRFAAYCTTSMGKLRGRMQQFAKHGNAGAMEALGEEASNSAKTARDVLALPPAGQ